MTVLQFVVSMSFKNYTAHATANCLYHSILMHEMILELIKYDRLRERVPLTSVEKYIVVRQI